MSGRVSLDLTCPHCGLRTVSEAPIIAARGMPSEGDASVCSYCMGIAVFTIVGDTIAVREATADELAEIEADADTLATRQALQDAVRLRD